jgi:hypothetical protein
MPDAWRHRRQRRIERQRIERLRDRRAGYACADQSGAIDRTVVGVSV